MDASLNPRPDEKIHFRDSFRVGDKDLYVLVTNQRLALPHKPFLQTGRAYAYQEYAISSLKHVSAVSVGPHPLARAAGALALLLGTLGVVALLLMGRLPIGAIIALVLGAIGYANFAYGMGLRIVSMDGVSKWQLGSDDKKLGLEERGLMFEILGEALDTLEELGVEVERPDDW